KSSPPGEPERPGGAPARLVAGPVRAWAGLGPGRLGPGRLGPGRLGPGRLGGRAGGVGSGAGVRGRGARSWRHAAVRLTAFVRRRGESLGLRGVLPERGPGRAWLARQAGLPG